MKRWQVRALAMLVMVVFLASRGMADDYADRMLFADGLYVRQMYDLALKEYAALLKSFPAGASNDSATFRLAECLRLKGDTVTAARFYAHVVANFSESPFRLRAAYRRARLYADAGDMESAVAHYRVILAETPPADRRRRRSITWGKHFRRKAQPTMQTRRSRLSGSAMQRLSLVFLR